MGERGPAPIPMKLAQLHGNPGKQKKDSTRRNGGVQQKDIMQNNGAKQGFIEVKDDAAERKKLLTPPAYLDKYAKAEWKRLAPKLIDAGVLTSADTAVFAGYCQSYGVFVTASKAIKARGDGSQDPTLVFETDKGYEMQIPELSIAANAKKQMLVFAKEFGLTPTSRITADEPENEEGASIMDFIKNKKNA